jgi:hypothetical protein
MLAWKAFLLPMTALKPIKDEKSFLVVKDKGMYSYFNMGF